MDFPRGRCYGACWSCLLTGVTATGKDQSWDFLFPAVIGQGGGQAVQAGRIPLWNGHMDAGAWGRSEDSNTGISRPSSICRWLSRQNHASLPEEKKGLPGKPRGGDLFPHPIDQHPLALGWAGGNKSSKGRALGTEAHGTPLSVPACGEPRPCHSAPPRTVVSAKTQEWAPSPRLLLLTSPTLPSH